jgi:hypothetical protein
MSRNEVGLGAMGTVLLLLLLLLLFVDADEVEAEKEDEDEAGDGDSVVEWEGMEERADREERRVEMISFNSFTSLRSS